MTDQRTPADELRTAADKLRALASAVTEDIATNPYWTSDEHPPHAHPSLYARGVDGGLGGPAGTYAAAMHPGVGRALAKLLTDCAELHEPQVCEKHEGCGAIGCQWCADEDVPCADVRNALAVARAINGTQEDTP